MSSWYVSPGGGNDSTGAGTKLSPFRTVTKANAVAAVGDEAIIVDGSHTLTASDVPTLSNLRTVRGESGYPQNCKINGAANAYTLLMIGGTAGANYTIGGFQIEANAGGSVVAFNATSGQANIIDLWFDNFKAGNVSPVLQISGASNTVNILGCLFRRFKGIPFGTVGSLVGAEAASWTNGRILLSNCTFYFDSTSSPNKNRGLVSYNNGTFTNSIVDFRNNIVASDMAAGLTVLHNATGLTILNRNNDFFSFPGAGAITQQATLGGGTFTTANNLTADPLFNDKAAGDFGLQPGSPCKRAGLILSSP